MKVFEKGDLVIYDPGIVEGSEIMKKRPAIIIAMPFPDQAIILPLTSKKRHYFFRIPINSEKLKQNPSWIMCDQVRAISIKRIEKKIDKIQNVFLFKKIITFFCSFLKGDI